MSSKFCVGLIVALTITFTSALPTPQSSSDPSHPLDVPCGCWNECTLRWVADPNNRKFCPFNCDGIFSCENPNAADAISQVLHLTSPPSSVLSSSPSSSSGDEGDPPAENDHGEGTILTKREGIGGGGHGGSPAKIAVIETDITGPVKRDIDGVEHHPSSEIIDEGSLGGGWGQGNPPIPRYIEVNGHDNALIDPNTVGGGGGIPPKEECVSAEHKTLLQRGVFGGIGESKGKDSDVRARDILGVDRAIGEARDQGGDISVRDIPSLGPDSDSDSEAAKRDFTVTIGTETVTVTEPIITNFSPILPTITSRLDIDPKIMAELARQTSLPAASPRPTWLTLDREALIDLSKDFRPFLDPGNVDPPPRDWRRSIDEIQREPQQEEEKRVLRPVPPTFTFTPLILTSRIFLPTVTRTTLPTIILPTHSLPFPRLPLVTFKPGYGITDPPEPQFDTGLTDPPPSPFDFSDGAEKREAEPGLPTPVNSDVDVNECPCPTGQVCPCTPPLTPSTTDIDTSSDTAITTSTDSNSAIPKREATPIKEPFSPAPRCVCVTAEGCPCKGYDSILPVRIDTPLNSKKRRAETETEVELEDGVNYGWTAIQKMRA